MRKASAYIAQVIAPRVRAILQENSADATGDFEHIMGWEQGVQSPGQRSRGWLLLPVLGAEYGLPLFAALLSSAAYVFSVSEVTAGDWLLIAFNGALLVYSAVLGYLVEFRRFGLEW